MTFHFIWSIRGHCSIIDWPNFSIIVSQGTGRPEDRERDVGMASECRSQNTHLLSSPSYMDVLQNSGDSNIIYHWSQITITHIIVRRNAVTFGYSHHVSLDCSTGRVSKNVIESWSEHMLLEKMVLIDLHVAGLPHVFSFFFFFLNTVSAKCIEVKHNKPKHSCLSINRHRL